VHKSAIASIVRRRTWRHAVVTDPTEDVPASAKATLEGVGRTGDALDRAACILGWITSGTQD
jgi:hypothetical protein